MSRGAAATHGDAGTTKLLAHRGRRDAQLGTDLAQGPTLGVQVSRTLQVHGGSVTSLYLTSVESPRSCCRSRERRNAEKNRPSQRKLREAARLPAVNTRGRLISGLVTTVMALAGFVTAGVLPAAAAPSTVQYVALGDSYAAGTASQLGGCPHGPYNYPGLLAGSGESRIDLTAFAACSGWRTSDVLDVLDDDGQPSPLSSHTRLVTLTVGAADLGLSRVLAACANPQTPDACRVEIGRVLALLGDCQEDKSLLYSSLTDLYADVVDEARGARIVVTGYPLLFESPPADDPRAAINEATTRLNCVIERAVAATQATYANIYYVDVTKEFTGHGIGCTGPLHPPSLQHPPRIQRLFTRLPRATAPMPTRSRPYCHADGWANLDLRSRQVMAVM